MKEVIIVKTIVGKKSYKLWFDCSCTTSSVEISDGKFLEMYAWDVVLNTKKSSKVYKKYFNVDLSSENQLKVEFKRTIRRFWVSTPDGLHRFTVVEGKTDPA